MDGGIIWTLLQRETEGPDVLFMEKVSYELPVLQTVGESADKLTMYIYIYKELTLEGSAETLCT